MAGEGAEAQEGNGGNPGLRDLKARLKITADSMNPEKPLISICLRLRPQDVVSKGKMVVGGEWLGKTRRNNDLTNDKKDQ